MNVKYITHLAIPDILRLCFSEVVTRTLSVIDWIKLSERSSV